MRACRRIASASPSSGSDLVATAQIDAVDAELARELVELRLGSERDLGHAEAAKRAEAQFVGVGDAAAGANVGNAVRAALHQQRIAEDARAVVAVGAAVEQDLDLARDERAVAASAGPDADRERMARPHRLEILLTRQDHSHRPARLHRQQHHRRLDVRLHLVAEAGADARRQAAQLGHRQAERFADARLHAKNRLVRRPQRDAARGLDLGQGADRLQRDVRLGLGGEGRLDDGVAAGPRRVDVAAAELGARAQVAVGAGVEDLDVFRRALVDQRRAGCERRRRIDDRSQLFVVDPDQARGLARDRLAVGGHRGDDLADVAHLALGERRLVLDEGAHPVALVEIVAGDDRAHAGQRAGRAQVIAADAGVRVRALQDRAVQHSGAMQVGDVLRAAAELVVAFELRDTEADRGAGERAHAADPHVAAARVAAALRTAATMRA
jgi:hypothetical protein